MSQTYPTDAAITDALRREPTAILAWDVPAARAAARAHLWYSGARWSHVQGVGALAETWLAEGRIDERIAVAAWLLDIGFGPLVRDTGFHPLDGATFLDAVRAPSAVVSLVAYHAGAQAEAEERGLTLELARFRQPPPADLDAVTLLDLSVGPSGQRLDPESRIAEILLRYDPESVVRRAVARSRDDLLASARRARRRLGL